MWLQMVLELSKFFLPLMGRIGASVNPDMLVGLMICVLTSNFLIVPLTMVHHLSTTGKKRHLALVGAVTVLTLLLNVYCWPYDANHPKRFNFQHIQRHWYDCSDSLNRSDSMVWIVPMDYLGMAPVISANIPFASAAQRMECSDMLCNLPFYFPVFPFFKDHWTLPAPPPFSKPLVTRHVVNEELKQVAAHGGLATWRRRVEFELHGPPQMALIVKAREAATVQLVDWSLGRTQKMDGEHTETFSHTAQPVYRSDCQCYFIFRASGNAAIPWRLWLTFEGELDENLKSDDIAKRLAVRVSVHAHDLETKTESLLSIQKQIPDWATAVMFSSEWNEMCI
eukprot:c13056_g1_i1.p1 GENE.c13056_g1_i1~~c13056_g1_i1.p1  ORF type:complete len:338 (+),score=59.89 c13056_g1_i1:433-1446(+)